MDDDFFLLFGILVFLLIFVYFACVPCGRRDPRRRPTQGSEGRRDRMSITGLFGFRESVRRGNNYTFQTSEPPPTYQWVMQHADAPLIAYVNEVTGHIEYVKWDGSGPIPTRTVLGIRNEGLEVEDPSLSDPAEPAIEETVDQTTQVT